jgi:hypothetical protein
MRKTRRSVRKPHQDDSPILRGLLIAALLMLVMFLPLVYFLS